MAEFNSTIRECRSLKLNSKQRENMADYVCSKCRNAFSVPDWLDTEIKCPKCAFKVGKDTSSLPAPRSATANAPTSQPQKPTVETPIAQSTTSSGSTIASAVAWRKILRFGAMGAVGCFLAALASELFRVDDR